jgi:hypothetical protein
MIVGATGSTGSQQCCSGKLRAGSDEDAITGERILKYDELRAGGARSRDSDH